jgi:hypothetical protein
MFRKLGLMVVAVLGVMVLAAPAQQPAALPVAPTTAPASSNGFPYYPMANPLAAMPLHREDLELARQSQDLVRKYAKAEGESKEAIKAKLTDLLGKQFDSRQKRYGDEIAALEAQVKRLRDLVQKRQENRQDIITRRFEQLVRETQGLGW